MIIAIIGDIGSGKSISEIRNILRRKRIAFCNFPTKIPYSVRLKKTDIVEQLPDPDNPKKTIYQVNWQFWEDARKEFKSFDIHLDEIHNITQAKPVFM